jgi:hypothetical protein
MVAEPRRPVCFVADARFDGVGTHQLAGWAGREVVVGTARFGGPAQLG